MVSSKTAVTKSKQQSLSSMMIVEVGYNSKGKEKEMAGTVDVQVVPSCKGPQQVIVDDQTQITSQSKMVLASLTVSSENRVKAVAIPGPGVTYQYGTRSRNQIQGSSGRRVPPSPANT